MTRISILKWILTFPHLVLFQSAMPLIQVQRVSQKSETELPSKE